jgi:hypothetical protein
MSTGAHPAPLRTRTTPCEFSTVTVPSGFTNVDDDSVRASVTSTRTFCVRAANLADTASARSVTFRGSAGLAATTTRDDAASADSDSDTTKATDNATTVTRDRRDAPTRAENNPTEPTHPKADPDAG